MLKQLMIGCSLVVLSVASLSAVSPAVNPDSQDDANTSAPARTPKQGLSGSIPFPVEEEMVPHLPPQFFIDLYVQEPTGDNPTYSWPNTVRPEDVMAAYIQRQKEAAEGLPRGNTKYATLGRIQVLEFWQGYIDSGAPQNLRGPLVQALLPLINSNVGVTRVPRGSKVQDLMIDLIYFKTGIPVNNSSEFQPLSGIEDDTFTLAQFNTLMARVNAFNTLRAELLPEVGSNAFIVRDIQEEALSVEPDELERRVEAIKSERNTLFNKFAEENPNTKGALIRWALRLTPDEIHERVANYQDELNDRGIDPDSSVAVRLMMNMLRE